MCFYYDSSNINISTKLSSQLTALITKMRRDGQTIVILCIGSDRSTGDSLGPIIGYKLRNYEFSNTFVYGSLYTPINANNLECAVNAIKLIHKEPFVIAIDASLGKKEHVGFITLDEGPLLPGLGVKNELPEVGDIHITGIVNVSGNMHHSLLQTTPLSVVMRLADIISTALVSSLCQELTGVLSD